MCSLGLATQAEDLYAAGVKELIHVGFAGGNKIGSRKATAIYVVSDSGSNDEWNLGWGESTLENSIRKLIDALAES